VSIGNVLGFLDLKHLPLYGMSAFCKNGDVVLFLPLYFISATCAF
jgi:hypothetical protein